MLTPNQIVWHLMKRAQKQLREAKQDADPDTSDIGKHVIDPRKKTPTLKELNGLYGEFVSG